MPTIYHENLSYSHKFSAMYLVFLTGDLQAQHSCQSAMREKGKHTDASYAQAVTHVKTPLNKVCRKKTGIKYTVEEIKDSRSHLNEFELL